MKTKSKQKNVDEQPTSSHREERLVRPLWVQYGHEDEKTAPVIQTADSEQEARDEDEAVMSGCCWYRYEIIPGERDGKLVNGNGPHYLTNVDLSDSPS